MIYAAGIAVHLSVSERFANSRSPQEPCEQSSTSGHTEMNVFDKLFNLASFFLSIYISIIIYGYALLCYDSCFVFCLILFIRSSLLLPACLIFIFNFKFLFVSTLFHPKEGSCE